MENMKHVAILLAFAGGFLGIGVGVGLGIYHFALGWFISHTSKKTLEAAVEAAAKHLLRRTARRHRRAQARHARAVMTAGSAPAPGRHLRQ
jgi:hypothetical protein